MSLIPAKLVKRIQEGCFIEMAELLLDLLRNASLPDDTNKSSKAKSHTIGSIIEWVQCFSCYNYHRNILLPASRSGRFIGIPKSDHY